MLYSQGVKMTKLTLHIEGMSCGHCLNAVNRALGALPGVEVDSVKMGRADVRYDERTTDPRQIEAAVTGAGYKATAAPAASEEPTP
jgi:copper chaperone CopZ